MYIPPKSHYAKEFSLAQLLLHPFLIRFYTLYNTHFPVPYVNKSLNVLSDYQSSLKVQQNDLQSAQIYVPENLLLFAGCQYLQAAISIYCSIAIDCDSHCKIEGTVDQSQTSQVQLVFSAAVSVDVVVSLSML